MSGPRTAKAKAARGPWAYIGPGIVSGASDNDPTTVATLAVVGSTTVYGLSWLVVLIVPMLAIVQAISAQVGAISKAGLEDCIKRSYGRGWALVALVSVLGVNILTLAADLEGGASALDLLTGIHYVWYIAPLAAGTAILLVYGNQQITERFLKVIPLVFFAYAFAAVAAHPDWGAIARATFVPHFEFTSPYVLGAIALLGTTLTSLPTCGRRSKWPRSARRCAASGSCKPTPRSAPSSPGSRSGSSSSRPARRWGCTTRPSKRPKMRLRRSPRSPVNGRRCCSASDCSALRCWRCRCWPGRART